MSERTGDARAGPNTEFRDAVAGWAALWGDPGLTEAVTISFSRRLRTALGRATPASGRIVLHAGLLQVPTVERIAVACHEVAHVAAWRRARAAGDPAPRPHGPEWARLVRAAGYAPTLRRQPPLGLTQRVRERQSVLMLAIHVCPVCQTRRVARRPVLRWRCAECVAAGLDGRLVIARQPAGDPSAVSRSGA